MQVTDNGQYRIGRWTLLSDEGVTTVVALTTTPNADGYLFMSPDDALELAASLMLQAELCAPTRVEMSWWDRMIGRLFLWLFG